MKLYTLTEKEMHLLYDLQYMMTKEVWETINLNDDNKILEKFFMKLEKRVCPELYKK